MVGQVAASSAAFPLSTGPTGGPLPCTGKIRHETRARLKPKHSTRFPPPPGGEEIYVVRHGATSAGTFLRHWTVDSLGPKLWVGPTTVPVFPRQSTPTRPPHITKSGVFGASSGPLGWQGLPSRGNEAGNTSVRDVKYGAFCAASQLVQALPLTVPTLPAPLAYHNQPFGSGPVRLPLGAPVRVGYHPLHLLPFTNNRAVRSDVS